MKIHRLPQDQKLFYVTATSFPNGVQKAFDTLAQLLPDTARDFYGISYKNEQDEIIYWAAAAESYEGEGAKYNCDTFTLTQGDYLTEIIFHWRDQIATIGTTFQRLIAQPDFDGSTPCVEWYKSEEELWCMVKTTPA